MQQPTCSDIRIRSTRDAHIVFHAVSLGILPIISRRLDADERQALRSGCIYAWEERGPHTEVTGIGIERFTEGRRWGPSRVRDEFLFYYEKSPPGQIRDKENPLLEERLRKTWDPLVKQTYSVWVDGAKGRRKWHLTAYFTQATVDRLKTVDDKPELAGLEVPPGKYMSTRLGKPRRTEETHGSNNSNTSVHDVFRPTNAPSARTYAPFPLPYQVTPPQHNSPPNGSHQPHQGAPQHLSPAGGGYDYAQQTQFSAAQAVRGEPSRQTYGAVPVSQQRYQQDRSNVLPPINALAPLPSAPPVDQQIPDYFSAMQSRRYPQMGQHSSIEIPSHFPPYAVHPPSQPPPAHEYQRPVMQLPTPTSSSSHSSPIYSPHEHPDGGSYGGHMLLPYPHQNSGVPLQPGPSYHTQNGQAYGHAYSQDRKYPLHGMTPYDQHAAPPSPEDHKSSSSGSPPRRPVLTLPPHITNRYSPPISDARDERGESEFSSLSPPQSPLSAVSSSSMPGPGGKQINLAPLRTLVRAQSHPYKRDKFDDRALMALSGRKVSD